MSNKPPIYFTEEEINKAAQRLAKLDDQDEGLDAQQLEPWTEEIERFITILDILAEVHDERSNNSNEG